MKRRRTGVSSARSVEGTDGGQLAAEVPELVLQNLPAHREAFIHLGPGGQTEPAQRQLISRSLDHWREEHSAQPTQLGARITHLADATVPEGQGPDCDFAIPFTWRRRVIPSQSGSVTRANRTAVTIAKLHPGA